MRVTFEVHAETSFGESLALVGSAPSLGEWEAGKSIALTTGPDEYPLWRSEGIVLEVNDPKEFKFIKVNGDQVTWEPAGNRSVPDDLDSSGCFLVDCGIFGSTNRLVAVPIDEDAPPRPPSIKYSSRPPSSCSTMKSEDMETQENENLDKRPSTPPFDPEVDECSTTLPLASSVPPSPPKLPGPISVDAHYSEPQRDYPSGANVTPVVRDDPLQAAFFSPTPDTNLTSLNLGTGDILSPPLPLSGVLHGGLGNLQNSSMDGTLVSPQIDDRGLFKNVSTGLGDISDPFQTPMTSTPAHSIVNSPPRPDVRSRGDLHSSSSTVSTPRSSAPATSRNLEVYLTPDITSLLSPDEENGVDTAATHLELKPIEEEKEAIFDLPHAFHPPFTSMSDLTAEDDSLDSDHPVVRERGERGRGFYQTLAAMKDHDVPCALTGHDAAPEQYYSLTRTLTGWYANCCGRIVDTPPESPRPE